MIIEPTYPQRVGNDREAIKLKISLRTEKSHPLAPEINLWFDVTVNMRSHAVSIPTFSYMTLNDAMQAKIKEVSLAFAKECESRKIV